jgi:hypothetical protein
MTAEQSKQCPLFKDACKQSECVFWMSSDETVMRNCAVVVIAQQLDILAVKGGSRPLG